MNTKPQLREHLRKLRREHVAALPAAMRALVFHRPPAPLLELVPPDAVIGLYRATAHEAPTDAYAKFFLERGHALALPRFASRDAEMEFAQFADPWEESDCSVGPFGLMQPEPEAAKLVPDVVFVPLLGFTETGDRIGQGGGHYDRWLAGHESSSAIGLAWDVQLIDDAPVEDHDKSLSAVVTPTRLYGPFA